VNKRQAVKMFCQAVREEEAARHGEWTVERVKNELPDVPYVMTWEDGWVDKGTARLSGRCEKFASLRPSVTSGTFSFAWETIVHVLNTGGRAII
jgi:hypothetical protein